MFRCARFKQASSRLILVALKRSDCIKSDMLSAFTTDATGHSDALWPDSNSAHKLVPSKSQTRYK